MRLKALAFLVPLEKISWIAGSERACLFSWYLLMQFIQNNRAKISADLLQKNKLYLKEEYLEGNAFPSDSSTQFRQILRVLDILSDKNLRDEWIIQTKDRWMRAFKSKSPFSYLLPENEHECIWTWNYLKEKILHWTTWPVFLVLLIFTTQFTFHLTYGLPIHLPHLTI